MTGLWAYQKYQGPTIVVRLEQLEFKLEKLLEFRNMQEKLENVLVQGPWNFQMRYMNLDEIMHWYTENSFHHTFAKGTSYGIFIHRTSINDVWQFSEIFDLPTLFNPKTSDFGVHFEPPHLP